MRVAYVVGWPEGPSSGPFKKISAQTAAWAAEGVDVGLFVLTIDRYAADWRALPAAREVSTRSSALRVPMQKEALIAAARRWQPDVIYHRWSLTYPGLVRAARTGKVVLEVNTDDVAEYDLMTPLKGRVNRLTRGVVLRSVAGVAYVTAELAAAPRFARYARPGIVMANGIDLDAVESTPPPANARPRLLFIGQPNCPWHGLDKLAELARLEPAWDFDVVGPPAADAGDPPPNIVFHGLLAAADYARLLARADIGVGTLALHRKSLEEASPLKVREYLAAGLPVINGYVDTDFPGATDFVLTLPNTEENLLQNHERIADFVRAWKGRRVPRERIEHVDHRAKERRRLAFFRSLI